MFRLLLYLLIFYLIWKLVEPYLKKIFNVNPEVKGKNKQQKIEINPDNIEDASYKDIDDSKNGS